MPEVYLTISDVPVQEWRAAVGPARLFRSYEWLASVEATFGRDRRYAIASGSSAGTTAYLADLNAYRFYNPYLCLTMDELLLQRAAGDREFRRLFESACDDVLSGCAEGYAVSTSPYGFDHPIGRTSRASDVAELVSWFEACADDWGIESRAWMYLNDSPTLSRELAQSGYSAFHGGANCVLELPGQSFDDYLGSLPRRRQKHVRAERLAFRDSGLTCVPGELGDVLDELATLQAALEAKYGNKSDVESEKVALRNIQMLGEKVRLFLCMRSGDIVGYELFYVDADRIYPKMGGYDGERLPEKSYAYFNCAYYEVIELAYTLGVRLIEYGPYSYEAKVTRGCTLQPLEIWYRSDGLERSADVQAVLDVHRTLWTEYLKVFSSRVDKAG